jgi:hypothetical protein
MKVRVNSTYRRADTLTNKTHPQRPRKMRRECGVGTFLDYMTELTKAAKKIQCEEQLMMDFNPTGKPIN